MNRKRSPWPAAIVVAALSFLVLPPVLYAADNDETRFYVAIRAGVVVKSTHQVAAGYHGTLGGEDVIGLSAGMNFNKYIGAEFSVDRYEFTRGALSCAVASRYPMLNDRLTPYLLGGGGGVGFVQVDDKFPR